MQGHIDGEQGVGAIPINEENKCSVLDIDIYDLDHNELQQRIQKLKLPLLHCRSKIRRRTFVFVSQRVRTGKSCAGVSVGNGSCSGTQDISFRSRILSWRKEVT